MTKQTRRDFVKGTAAFAAGIFAGPRFAAAQGSASANHKLNVAVIGAGGRGGASLKGCSNENIVAICDVNDQSAAKAREQYSNAKYFHDFRVMMDKMNKEIDAVCVATPDHTHFAAAMCAMQNHKHVYVEKPLAHNVWQVRTLKKAAHHYNVISQMGNQGHATDGIRSIKEWFEADVIGDVKEVVAWFNGPDFQGHYFSKPENYPPQAEDAPEHLQWDLWLGPARERPYSHYYLPRHWRGWYDFGNAELGDWACHTLDGPFWALQLGMPEAVETVQRSPSPEGFTPDRSIIRFSFPARGGKPPVVLSWHDGGLKPDLRPEWGLDKLPGSGMIMIGDKCSLMTGGRPNDPKLLPESVWTDFSKNPTEKTIPRVDGGPWDEWINAIKGDGPMPGSNFDYSSDLTEMTLLGVLVQRFNKRIEYDAANMKIVNDPMLDAFIKEPVREGWSFGEEVWKA
ncbi:MAG: Gfo/Idh/MocA family oxidoreductase [Candidatus Omnitrophica bacterium]|nr:Gfo/Idh/MocA family oxidoreductase [Candidatus Omnitrophota bacterium]